MMLRFLTWEETKLAGGGGGHVCASGYTGVGGAEDIPQNGFYRLAFLLRVRE